MNREELITEMKKKEKDFEEISDAIWGFAETCYEEKKSMEIQREYLEKQGFRTAAPAYGIDTAMMAEYGEGGPVIAILGEYDALDNLSQAADVAMCEPLKGNGKGHGCGHNLLGTAGVEAACAVRKYLEASHLPGRIRYYGCPAEEGGAGKIYMIRAGAFQDVDIALSWHPAARTGLMTACLSTLAGKFFFKGVASHAAAAPEKGKSALDAAELMNMGVQFLREHIPDGSRIHYAFHDVGGSRPNIVQSTAALYYVVRGKDNEAVESIFQRVVKIAKGAAMMTETELLPVEITNAYSNILPNTVLLKLMTEEGKKVYPIPLTEKQKQYGRTFNQAIDESEGDYNTEFMETPAPFGSTDFGDVSWVVPGAAFTGTCFAERTAGHSWALTAQGKSEPAHMGMHAAAQLMAVCSLDLFSQPRMIEEAKKEFAERTKSRAYHSLLPEDARPRILFS